MTAKKPRAYIASPLGFAESTRLWYETILLPLLSKYVEVLDPWKVDVQHILAAPTAARPELWLDLGDQHYKTIKDKADLVVAVLDQEPPDIGTVCEVVWAAAHDKPVIGYRNDLRTSGEPGLPYNLMLGAAIRNSGGLSVLNLAELETALQNIVEKLSV